MSKLKSKRKFESPDISTAKSFRKKLEFPEIRSVISTKKDKASDVVSKQQELEYLLTKQVKLDPDIAKLLSIDELSELSICGRILLPTKSDKVISSLLKTNKSLKTLKLIENGINFYSILSISEGLSFNNTLTYLDLSFNGISCNGVAILAKALAKNSSLTYLNLAENHINIHGGIAIASLLKTNKTIKTLNLGRNIIVDEGTWALADALKVNTTLRSLNLHKNFIKATSMDKLLVSLNYNKTLTQLDISGNFIFNAQCALLANFLKTNAILDKIDVTETCLSSAGAYEINASMLSNFTITCFEIDSISGVTKGLIDSIKDYAKRNMYLQDTVYNFAKNIIAKDLKTSIAGIIKIEPTIGNIKMFKLLNKLSVPALKHRLESSDIDYSKFFKSLNYFNAKNFLPINYICKDGLFNEDDIASTGGQRKYSKLEASADIVKTLIGEFLGEDFLGKEIIDTPTLELTEKLELSGDVTSVS